MDQLKKLQALIIADCYENKFVPLSNTKTPQCLFPVANVPNLHYVIEFLMMNQIKEIIIVSRLQGLKTKNENKLIQRIKSKHEIIINN